MLVVLAFAAVLIGSGLTGIRTSAQDDGEVIVATISGTIDLGLAPYLQRVLDDAESDGARAVLLIIDTPGGRLDAVLQMRDALLGSNVPTIAFVDRSAFSAGALVAIASEQIYMAPGSSMGAATPIDGVTGETADEKTVSAVRATFASTAEARGRDPLIAEAMVDPAVVIDGLDTADQLLTLTSSQALSVGYADGIYENRTELLDALGLGDAPIREVSTTFVEELVRILTSPVVASLLLLGGMLLIIGSFFSEGIGILTLVGLALLGLFFYGHMLAGLAGWEGVLLVVLGLALIAVELLIVPGFGIPGITGLIALAAGIFLSLSDRDIRTPEQTRQAMIVVAVVMGGLLIGTIALFTLLPRSRALRGLILSANVAGGVVEPVLTAENADRGWLKWFGGGSMTSLRREDEAPPIQPGADPMRPTLVSRPMLEPGTRGDALSDLRPAGVGSFAGERLDVVTEGEYITRGEPIEVMRDDQYRIVVRRAQAVPVAEE